MTLPTAISDAATFAAAGAERKAPSAARGSAAQSDRPGGRTGAIQHAAVLAFFSQGISSATNFLRLWIIVRMCGETQQELVGVYALGMTVVLLAMALHERLIEAPYTVFFHRETADGRRRLLGNTVLLSAAVNAVFALGIMACGGAVLWSRPESAMGPMLVAMGLATPMIVVRELARSAAFADFRMTDAIAIDTATLVIQTSLLAWMWITGGASVAGFYGVVAISCAAPIAGWLWLGRGDWTMDVSRIRGDVASLWSFSRWLVAARLMGNASRMIIPWIVFAMLGKIEAGLLATCASLVGLAWLFVRGVNNYFRPYAVKAFADGGPSAVRGAVAKTAAVFTALLLPICLLLGFAGDQLLAIVYGAELSGVGSVVFLLALNTLATSWAIAANNGLVALGRPHDTLWGEGVTLIATLLAAPILISTAGLAGAAVAMLLGNLAGAAATAVLFERGLSRQAAEALSDE